MNLHVLYFISKNQNYFRSNVSNCVVIASDIKICQRTGYLFDLDKIDLNEVLDSLLINAEMLNSVSSNAKDFVINNNHLSILTKNMNKDYLELI